MQYAALGHMTMDLEVLKCGNCERVKLGVHGLALGLAALCGAYNAAAWLSRREQHLAINAVLYAVLIAFEHQHVSHHIAELRRPNAEPGATPAGALAEIAPLVAVVAVAAADVAA
jgi:hypothetical protein